MTINRQSFENTHTHDTEDPSKMSFLTSTRDVVGFLLLSLFSIIEGIVKLFIPLKYKMKSVSGEIALVTGGGGGLGRLISLRLANLGAVVVVWDINKGGKLSIVTIILPFSDRKKKPFQRFGLGKFIGSVVEYQSIVQGFLKRRALLILPFNETKRCSSLFAENGIAHLYQLIPKADDHVGIVKKKGKIVARVTRFSFLRLTRLGPFWPNTFGIEFFNINAARYERGKIVCRRV